MIELRPSRPAEIGEICALMNRSEEHDGCPRRTSTEELREEFEGSVIDLELDTRSVFLDGTLVAAGHVYHPRSGERQERAYVFGEVDPAHRGRGVGRELLAWQMQRAREVLADATPGLPRYIRASGYDFQTAAHALYARAGLLPVRTFDEMVAPLTDLPARPELDGIDLVPWPHDRDEELRIAKNSAFAEHWGSAPMNPGVWADWLAGETTRLDLSVVALDRATGAIAGHCVVAHYPQDAAVTGRDAGWIDNIGVLPAWRGRGIAAALIVDCFHRFVAEGFTHAVLEVDVENETRAQAVYQRLGFRTEYRVVQRELEVRPG